MASKVYGWEIKCHYGKELDYATEVEDSVGEYASLELCKEHGESQLQELERHATGDTTYSLTFYELVNGCYEPLLISLP